MNKIDKLFWVGLIPIVLNLIIFAFFDKLFLVLLMGLYGMVYAIGMASINNEYEEKYSIKSNSKRRN